MNEYKNQFNYQYKANKNPFNKLPKLENSLTAKNIYEQMNKETNCNRNGPKIAVNYHIM